MSGFGHTGPYATRPAYDMVVQAMGGIMSLTGHPGNPPTRVGTSIGDLTAALYAALGIVSALYDRKSTGKGMKVDISMLDCQVAFLENAIARYVATGVFRPARLTPSFDRAVCGLRHQGQPHRHRRRNEQSLRARG